MIRFLFAADFSDASKNAFLYVKSLAKEKNIKIDIINVFDLPISYTTQTPSRAVQGYIHELKQASLKRLTSLLHQLPIMNRGVVHPVYGLYPSSEIEEMAKKLAVDMIIMSLRKDYGIFKRMMGNTTAKTIYKSTIPVMAIPAKTDYREINNILFPTAIGVCDPISDAEIKAIKWLSLLSGFLNIPDIELIHIVDDEDPDAVNVTIYNSNIDNVKLTYSHAMTVEEGIFEYMKKKNPDLLAFYKPHRTFWERVYRPSKTRHLLYDSNIPLLIF